MISVGEARRLVGEHLPARPLQIIPTTEPRAMHLAEPVVADREFPPYDRVAMDGIALKLTGSDRGLSRYRIQAVQAAGQPPIQLQDEGFCIEVMTGAVLPIGCDAVIRYEDCTIERQATEATALIADEVELVPWMNIHRRGSDRQQGDLLIPVGTKLEAPHWAVIASVGREQVKTISLPRVAILSTGDELVPISALPAPHQIRTSNGYAIQAALHRYGIQDLSYHHVGDDPDALRSAIAGILSSHDLLITVGAVSKGRFDYLPSVFSDLKIKKVFHEVRQRPGKPLWFGTAETGQLVFGLPGNPVSVLVGLYAHIFPCLRRWLRTSDSPTTALRARLSREIQFEKPMTLFQPVRFRIDESAILWADPVRHNGSGDFAALLESDGFVELPEERNIHRTEDAVLAYRWDQP